MDNQLEKLVRDGPVALRVSYIYRSHTGLDRRTGDPTHSSDLDAELSRAIRELEKLPPSESVDRDVTQRQGRERYFDGGITMTTVDILTIAIPALSALAAFLKVARPIIIQILKNKAGGSIEVTRGDVSVKVKGPAELDRLIAAVNELSRPTSEEDDKRGGPGCRLTRRCSRRASPAADRQAVRPPPDRRDCEPIEVGYLAREPSRANQRDVN